MGAIKAVPTWLVAALTFVLVLALGGTIVYQMELSRVQAMRALAQAHAADHAQALQQNLLQALSATRALAALVRQGNGAIADFATLAADMLPMYPGVAALALEPNGVVQQIFPLQGNSAALGLDLLNHPLRQQEAKRARDSGQLTLAGPFELVPGGLGALGFYPVFLHAGNEQRHFWGFTSVVIRLPQALGPAQFEHLVRQGYDYRLWRVDPTTQRRQIIAQSPTEHALEQPFDQLLSVPNAQWTLSVAPLHGWSDPLGLAQQAALVLLVSGLLAALAKHAWQSKIQVGHLQASLQVHAEQVQSVQEQLQATLDALPDLLFEMDAHGRYLACHTPHNPALLAPVDQLLGRSVHSHMPAAPAQTCLQALEQAQAQGRSQGLQIELTLHDGVHWFELSVAAKATPPGQAASFLVLLRDVTARQAAQAKARRLSQLYAALSQCNQAIVRCQSEAELFESICRDVVNFGGMKLAWVGAIDQPSQRVAQQACFGAGAAYVQTLEVSLDASLPSGQSPTAVALREGEPCWCQDFQNDALTAPWQARARQFGLASYAALPLRCGSRVMGGLMVYAAYANAFDEASCVLLREMVTDINFALDRFAAERQRARVEQDLRESEERYRKAFRTSPDSININRLVDGLYLDVNQGFERMTGWRETEVIGKTSADIAIWHRLEDRQRLVECLRTEGRCLNLEADFVKKDGKLVRCLMSAEVVQFNGIDCILSITRDITERQKAAAEIERLAHFDPLTSLPNRTLLQERFNLAASMARRSGESLALLFLDLDHFKNINDNLGHSMGDRLLQTVSRRMLSVLREQDSLARFGGDEFILLLPAVNQDGAAQVAAKLIDVVAQPVLLDQQELVNTLSIGIAIFPDDGEDFETLSKNADAAMYRVKRSGRNDFCFFTHEMQLKSARALQLVSAMHHALERSEFSLHYQPQINLHDGRIVGAEALLRWFNAELGALAPMEFIPLAEDSGQILAVGAWVLRQAMRQLRAWLDDGMTPLVVAVNLSAVQFRHPDLFALVTDVLRDTGVPPALLELELTEAATMDNPVTAIALMDRLNAFGVRMSIDDFGTGYSSLSYLKKFKIDKLKIDQSFVRDISDDPDDKAIVSAIIKLADGMGLHTIAEGVETQSQLAYLQQQDCEQVQGYYFSKPLPAADFAAFVRLH